ncbi:MAG: BamA/TamA family outer membrane protein, partial [Myxococcota bacterium]
IIIRAEDKHSWVVAPTYYNQPTNQGGGIGYGENNLFGTNKKLLLYAQVATGDSFLVAGYIDPAILGSRFMWQVDTYLLRARAIEYAAPEDFTDKPREVRQSKLNYLNSGIRLGVNMSRGLALNVRLRGARVFYDDTELAEGAVPEDLGDGVDAANLPEPGAEGWDVSTEVWLDYDRRANWYGLSDGYRYKMTFNQALTALGSDFDYWTLQLDFERAKRIKKSMNLIIKAVAAYGQDVPFQGEFTAGGTNLRGYKNEQFRGNFKLGANVEYSVPAFSIKGVALRLVGFYDTAYTTFLSTDDNVGRNYLPGHDQRGLSPFKNTIGVGTRLYIRQVVIPLLGLDLGYGIERNSYEIYLAIGLTDV